MASSFCGYLAVWHVCKKEHYSSSAPPHHEVLGIANGLRALCNRMASASCFRRIMQHRGYFRGEIRSFTASLAECNRRRAPSSCVPRFSFPCERASLTFKAILLFLRPESPRFATHVLGRGIDARLRSGGGVFRHHHVGLQGGAEYFRGGHGRQNLELRRRRGGGAAYFGDI